MREICTVLNTILIFTFLGTCQLPAQGPKLIIQTGHSEPVRSVAFSPDGTLLASGGLDRTIRLWHIATGKEVRKIELDKQVDWVGFTADGQKLITKGMSENIEDTGPDEYQIWDVANGKLLKTKTLSFQFKWLDLRVDDNVALICVEDWEEGSRFEVRHVTTGKRLLELSIEGGVSLTPCAAYSPGGDFIAGGGEAELVTVWDPTGAVRHVFRLHDTPFDPEEEEQPEWIVDLKFTPDGRYLIAAGNEQTIKMWDIQTGKLVRSFGPHPWPKGLDISPDGSRLATSGENNTIKIWEVATGKELLTFKEGEEYTDPVFSPDGQLLAVPAWRNVSIRNSATGEENVRLQRTVSFVGSIALSEDVTLLAAFSAFAHDLFMWDLNTGTNTLAVKDTTIRGGFLFPAGSKSLLLTTKDGIFTQTGVKKKTRLKLDPGESFLALSASGEQMVTRIAENVVRLRDYSTGEMIRDLEVPSEEWVDFATFSPDGKQLACGGSEVTRIWEVATGKLVRSFNEEARAILFFRNSDSVVAAWNAYKGVQLWDLARGLVTKTLSAWPALDPAMALSPDDRYLAAGEAGLTVRVWDLTSGQVVADVAQGGETWQLTFTADGKYLVNAGGDGAVRFMTTADWSEVVSLYSLRERDWIAVTPDGRFDGTPGGMELLHWSLDNEPYSLDQFFANAYTPGLLAWVFHPENLSEDDLSVVKSTGNVSGGFGKPPAVTFVESLWDATKGITIDAGKIEEWSKKESRLFVHVENRGGGVGAVRLFQNGKLVHEISPGSAGGKMPSTMEFPVTLLDGLNVFHATAFSDDGVESRPVELRIRFKEPKAEKPMLHLLIAGINQYKDAVLNLKYARPDGEAMGSFFGERCVKMFSSCSITELYDENAGGDAIEKAIDAIAAKANPEDIVMLYFSGHGETVKQNFYFLPYESRQVYDEENVMKYGITAGTIGEKTKQIKARKVVITFDACKSGGSLLAFRGIAEQKALAMLAKSFGLHVINASTGQQYAMEATDLGHGVLTYSILEGLKGAADANGDRIVTIFELTAFLNERVAQLTNEYYNMEQYPTTMNRGMDFPLMIVE